LKRATAIFFRAAQAGLVSALLCASLMALPPFLTGSRVFTCLFALAFAAVAARIGRRWRVPEGGVTSICGLATLVPVLVIADVAAFLHTGAPFWMVADTDAFCRSIGAATAACRRAAQGDQTLSALPEPPAGPFVYLAAQGWHTALILPTMELDEGAWPFARTLKGRRYVDVGWGDAVFYQAEVQTAQMALGAFFVPGPSVLQINPFDADPAQAFPGAEVVRVPVTHAGMASISRYIGHTMALDPEGRPTVTGPGDGGPESHFYKANGLYYFPNTCNAWAARALVAGGVPVTPELAVTSRNLIRQARQVGFGDGDNL
jgi:uncharacterized protein (TIGR02117 family)